MATSFGRAIAIVFCGFLLSCGSRHVKEPPDTERPAVISLTPAANATAVAVATNVAVTFSESMDPSSISGDVITLVSGVTGSTVTGSVVYDPAGSVAVFSPDMPLVHDTVYTAKISAQAKDEAGNTLGAATSWSFMTIPASGAQDRTFGSGGLVRTSVGAGTDVALAAALQHDGKIIAAGYSLSTTVTATQIVYENYFTLLRYNQNGSADTSFGLPLNNGGKITDFAGTAAAVAIQPDDKITAAGTTGDGADVLVARYTGDGRIDDGFGEAGRTVIDLGGASESAAALVLQDDTDIIIAGSSVVTTPSTTTSRIFLARLLADGSLDGSFGGGGRVLNDSYDNSWAAAAAVQPDGNILVAGSFQSNGGLMTPLLLRYKPSGAPDADFNGGAVAPSAGQAAELRALHLMNDGRIIAAGTIENPQNGTSDLFLMRCLRNGGMDTSFGPEGTGMVRTDFNIGEEGAVAIGLDAEGRVLVAAQYRKTTGQPLTADFAVFRYTADGELDPDFGGGFGMVHTDFGGSGNDFTYGMLIQPDGKIILAGAAWNGANYDFGLCRYWP